MTMNYLIDYDGSDAYIEQFWGQASKFITGNAPETLHVSFAEAKSEVLKFYKSEVERIENMIARIEKIKSFDEYCNIMKGE